MPHGYSVDVDDSETLRYSKFHKNGEKTEVQADIVSSAKSSGPEKWRTYVDDPNGRVDLGKFRSKRKAKSEMKSWMRGHEKGVPASDKRISGGSGGIPGQDSGVPGYDGNGLF